VRRRSSALACALRLGMGSPSLAKAQSRAVARSGQQAGSCSSSRGLVLRKAAIAKRLIDLE
jgi:hypothetical protein